MTQLPRPKHTEHAIRHLERMVRNQGTVISWINTLITEFLMPGQAELVAELAAVKQAVVDDQASDQAVVNQLDQVIADLKAGADTGATIAALEDIKSQISTVSSPNTPPSPTARKS